MIIIMSESDGIVQIRVLYYATTKRNEVNKRRKIKRNLNSICRYSFVFFAYIQNLDINI